VFTLFVVASVVMTVVMVQLLFDQITGVSKDTRRGVLLLTIPGMVVGLVINWFVVATIMHFLGGKASNTGTFADALAVAGWAYARTSSLFRSGYFNSGQKLSPERSPRQIRSSSRPNSRQCNGGPDE